MPKNGLAVVVVAPEPKSEFAVVAGAAAPKSELVVVAEAKLPPKLNAPKALPAGFCATGAEGPQMEKLFKVFSIEEAEGGGAKENPEAGLGSVEVPNG